MATSTTEDYDLHFLSRVVGLQALCLSVLPIHLFIAIVNAMDWLKGRPLTAIDQITMALGTSRVIFQLSILIDVFLEFLQQEGMVLWIVLGWAEFMVISSNYCCICLASLLSATYCLNICSFRNVIFQYLKKLVAQRTAYVISVTVLVSALFHFAFLCDLHFNHYTNFTKYTEDSDKVTEKYTYYFLGGHLAPFLVHSISSALLIVTLRIHLHKIKSSNIVNTEMHPIYNALKYAAVCFICFAIQIVSLLIMTHYYNWFGADLFLVISNVLLCLHSMFLIYMTAKLRSHFSRIVRCGTNCPFKGRAS